MNEAGFADINGKDANGNFIGVYGNGFGLVPDKEKYLASQKAIASNIASGFMFYAKPHPVAVWA